MTELGEKIIKLWKNGCTKSYIAKKLGIGRGTVKRTIRKSGLDD